MITIKRTAPRTSTYEAWKTVDGKEVLFARIYPEGREWCVKRTSGRVDRWESRSVAFDDAMKG